MPTKRAKRKRDSHPGDWLFWRRRARSRLLGKVFLDMYDGRFRTEDIPLSDFFTMLDRTLAVLEMDKTSPPYLMRELLNHVRGVFELQLSEQEIYAQGFLAGRAIGEFSSQCLPNAVENILLENARDRKSKAADAMRASKSKSMAESAAAAGKIHRRITAGESVSKEDADRMTAIELLNEHKLNCSPKTVERWRLLFQWYKSPVKTIWK